MIRVVFFDIDGTLLSPRSNRMPGRAARAIKALRERGVRVVIATGRHPIELDGAHLDGLEFDGYAAANGQMCLDGERRLFAGFPVGTQGTEALTRMFEQGAHLLWLFGVDDSYANRYDAGLVAMAQEVSGTTPDVRTQVDEVIYQAVAFVNVEDEPELQRMLPGCRLQRWGDQGVDIIAAEGGKVEGMRAFLERFGCRREECMAFGDQHNDIDMLRFAGIGVAMGNATPAARAAADYVTAAVDEDGVALALEHFGLLEPGWDVG